MTSQSCRTVLATSTAPMWRRYPDRSSAGGNQKRTTYGLSGTGEHGFRGRPAGHCLLAELWQPPRRNRRRVIMAIGLGIVLLVLGLILALDVVQVDMDFINDGALGGILIVAGLLAIVISLIVNQQR